MVQNIITLDEETDKLLNIIKATLGVKNKNQALTFLIKHYNDTILKHGVKAAVTEAEHHQHNGHYIG